MRRDEKVKTLLALMLSLKKRQMSKKVSVLIESLAKRAYFI